MTASPFGFVLAIELVVLAASVRQSESPGRVSGTVEDLAEWPMAAVGVLLISPERVLQTQTSLNGSFAFEQVEPGSYMLEVKAHGFQKKTVAVTIPADGREQKMSVELGVGMVPDPADCGSNLVVLYSTQGIAGSHVRGKVRSFGKNDAIPNAELQLRNESNPQTFFTAKSDRDGRFAIAILTPGWYTVRITGAKYIPVELKHVAIPRENAVFLEGALASRKSLYVCQ